jgi:hypothetical protein
VAAGNQFHPDALAGCQRTAGRLGVGAVVVGQELAQARQPDRPAGLVLEQQVVVRHLRPYAFLLPPDLLHPGRNQLTAFWGSRETLVLVPRMRLGPGAIVEPWQVRQLFREHTAVQASLVLAAVVALGVWWRQRRLQAPTEYLLIGVGALGWLGFNSALFCSPIAVEWFLWRRVIGIGAIRLFVLGMGV